MNYKILLEETAADLEAAVNEYLQEGWELQGGVSMVVYEKKSGGDYSPLIKAFRFAQAVVKKAPYL
jgi:Domain of unknown function (DUF1737)